VSDVRSNLNFSFISDLILIFVLESQLFWTSSSEARKKSYDDQELELQIFDLKNFDKKNLVITITFLIFNSVIVCKNCFSN